MMIFPKINVMSFTHIILIFLLVSPSIIFSQNTDIGALLSDGLRDEKISILNQYDLRLGTLDDNLPFLEKVEFRSELDRMMSARQEFLIRTSFNGLGQIKAERHKFNALLARKSEASQIIKNEVISQKYQDIIELILIIRNIEMIKEYQFNLDERIKMSETILSNGLSPDLLDYIQLKESVIQMEIKKGGFDLKWKVYTDKLKIDTSANIDLTRLPEPSQMKSYIDSLKPDFDQHPEIRGYVFESQYLKADLNVQRSKSTKILDFAQVRHTLRDDLLLQNRFSIGVGLNVPWSGSFSLKRQDINIKLEEASTKKELKKVSLKTSFNDFKNTFYYELNQYKMWQSLHSDTVIVDLKNKIINSRRLDPLKILSLKESELDASSKALEHYEKLLKIYINILDITGELYSKPLRNYLHVLRPVLID